MATNFYKKGDVLDVAASGAVSSGDIVPIGGVIGVAITDAGTGEVFAVQVTGEWILPKTTGTAITIGDPIDFDVSTGEVTTGLTPVSGDVSGVGIATQSAGSAATSVRVLLTPGTGTVTP